MDGEKNVGEIEKEFESTISNISQHLTILRKGGNHKPSQGSKFHVLCH